jgi:branched-chain amino acid transport system substrate-binding protein
MSSASERSTAASGPLQYAPRYVRDAGQVREIRDQNQVREQAAAAVAAAVNVKRAAGEEEEAEVDWQFERPYPVGEARRMHLVPPETPQRSWTREIVLLTLVASIGAGVAAALFTRSHSDGGATSAAPAEPPVLAGTFNTSAPPPARPPATSRRMANAAPTAVEEAPSAAPPAAAAPVVATAPSGIVATQRATAPAVRGVTETEIRLGMAAPFSGAARELGRQMKLGIDSAFNAVNAAGGVHGRQLRLIAADDGYEPTRTSEAMKQLYEKDQVFGVVGNVGTPTAMVAVPYSLERKMLFFGAFTGAGLLRRDPPDRYVFNYRASYAEETDATVRYLVKVRGIKPEHIAVFAQQDAYGDAGFAGVTKAIRALKGGDGANVLRLNYTRNTVDVADAVEHLRTSKIPIKAVVMVPTYRAAARFIEKTRDMFPGLIYTNVSFVGSTALAEELRLLGPKYTEGVIVTQVVPAIEGYSSFVLEYKNALAKSAPGEAPDYVSLEGYITGSLLAEGLRRGGREIDTEKLVDTLENLRNYDMGLGTPLTFGRAEHQGSHKVWGTQLDDKGHYQAIDLQ